MQISDEQIIKFQVLFRKHFGVDINKSDALKRGKEIVRLVEIVLKDKNKVTSTHTTN